MDMDCVYLVVRNNNHTSVYYRIHSRAYFRFRTFIIWENQKRVHNGSKKTDSNEEHIVVYITYIFHGKQILAVKSKTFLRPF